MSQILIDSITGYSDASFLEMRNGGDQMGGGKESEDEKQGWAFVVWGFFSDTDVGQF